MPFSVLSNPDAHLMRTSYVQLIKHIVKFIAAVSVAIYSVAYVYALMLKSDAKNFELCGEQSAA